MSSDNNQKLIYESLEILIVNSSINESDMYRAMTENCFQSKYSSISNDDKEKNEKINKIEIIKTRNHALYSKNKKKKVVKKISEKRWICKEGQNYSFDDKIDIKQNWNIAGNKDREKAKIFNNFSEENKFTNFSSNIEELKIPKQLGFSSQKGYPNINYSLLIKILSHCLNNICSFFNKRIKSKFKKKYKLDYINVENLTSYGKNKDNLKEIFESNLLDILLGKLSSKKNKTIIKKIKQLIEIESKNKNIKVKVLGRLFYKKIIDIFNMYMTDNYYIDDTFKFNFITIKKELNEYTINEREEIKIFFPFSTNDKLVNTSDNQNKQENDVVLNKESSNEPNIIKSSLPSKDYIRRKITRKGLEYPDIIVKEEYNRLFEYEKKEKILYNKYLKDELQDEKLIKFFKEELNTDKKYNDFINEKLPKIQIKNQIGKSVSDYNVFFSQNFEEIYINSIPKNIKKIDIPNYKARTNIRILFALEIEKEKKKDEVKYLNIYLKKIKVVDYLKSFIDDKKVIKYYDNCTEKEIVIENFKIFNFFSEEFKDKKEDIINDYKNLLNREIKSRKSSQKRNSSLKNNPNLKRKRTLSNDITTQMQGQSIKFLSSKKS